MKNLPDKIYLNLNMTPQEVVETKDKDFHEATKTWEITWSEEHLSEHDPEYIRKDAFIEKAAEYIANNMQCNGYTLQTKAKFIRDFKKYMERTKVCVLKANEEQNNKQLTEMEKLKQVDVGYEFNKEGYGWSETVITDESVLAVLEMRYDIQIALAIEYKEGVETKSIRIVTKDRKHYKLFFV